MSADVTDSASAREVLGLRPSATDAEVRETYREFERFLAPSNVPRRLQEWAARERSNAGRALASTPTPAAAPAQKPAPTTAKPTPRPSDLPDLFDEDIRTEAPASRPTRTARTRPPARPVAAPAARRPSSGLLSWRSAVLVLGFGIVVLAILIGTAPPGGISLGTIGLGTSGAGTSDTSQASAAAPLDTARVAELTKAVQKNPNDTTSLFELGEMHFQANKWQETIDWFTKLLAIDPSDTHARTDVGTASYNLGRYDDARAAWEEVIRRDPKDAQAHYNLAFYYLNGPAPDLDKALAEWQKVIDVAPDSTLAKTAKTHIDALKK